MDVPQLALLVLPSTASVHRAIYELRLLGINAHALELRSVERGEAHLLRNRAFDGNPTLLVSTLATTRGLDLVGLSHVFILGVPEDQRVDAYLHLAGRVGRMGSAGGRQGGRVVSILQEDRMETVEGKTRTRSGARVLRQIFKTLGITPTRYELFD